MSGIEKICELSGKYLSHLMYSYKRNSIQVMPSHRKLFAKQEHTLYIAKKTELYEIYSSGGRLQLAWPDPNAYVIKYRGKWYGFRQHRMSGTYKRISVGYKHEFCLHVPGLQGRVDGYYYNHTFDLGTTKRKLKRMLKCRDLNIVYVDEATLDGLRT